MKMVIAVIALIVGICIIINSFKIWVVEIDGGRFFFFTEKEANKFIKRYIELIDDMIQLRKDLEKIKKQDNEENKE